MRETWRTSTESTYQDVSGQGIRCNNVLPDGHLCSQAAVILDKDTGDAFCRDCWLQEQLWRGFLDDLHAGNP